jgi:CHASE1-domain containing sensor protein
MNSYATSVVKLTYRNLLIALAYAATGWLGLQLAIQPGYATVVWPASGVALAAILLRGNSCAPGIVLGSFLVNYLNGGVQDPSWSSIAVPLIIGMGAAVQAVVGSALIKRFVKNPFDLEEQMDVLLFTLYGAVGACLIAASVGVTTLWMAGIIPAEKLMYSWATWWLGDALGVVIFGAPLAIFGGRVSALFGYRFWYVLLPTGAAFIATLVSARFVSSEEDKQLLATFEQDASRLALVVKNYIDEDLRLLRSIRNFYVSSVEMHRDEFSEFVQEELERRPELKALEWAPVVPHAERETFERKARAEGFSGFRITQRDRNGQMVPATHRKEYVPVTFLEPMQGNENAVGFDLASDPIRAQTLALARQRRTPAATEQVNLVQDGPDKNGFLILHPAFEGDTLAGYVIGVLYIKDLLDAALNPWMPRGMEMRLTETGVESPLLETNRDLGPSDYLHKWTAELDVAGRTWELEFLQTDFSVLQQRIWQEWLVLTAGLSSCALVCLFSLVITGNMSVVRSLNAQLFDDHLHAKTLLEKVLDSAQEGILQVEAKGEIVAINPAAEQIFGVTQSSKAAVGPLNSLIPQLDLTNPARKEYEGIRMDGSSFPLEATISHTIISEAEVFLVVLRDISERKEHEAQLIATNRELRESNEELNNFATITSHDLKEPLRGISNYAQLLLEDYKNLLDEKGKAKLLTLVELTKRMADLINSLLGYSRVGQTEMKKTKNSINAVVQDAAESLQVSLEEQRFDLRIDPELPELHCDPVLLGEVFMNLISNAMT